MIYQIHSLLKYPVAALALLILSSASCVTAAEDPVSSQTELDTGFQNPPPENRPWVYWFFMDGNMTREGMTADLEAMRDAGIESVNFDDAAAKKYGKIRSDLAFKGTPIGPNDLMIASIALVNDMVLVTHNTREFSRVATLKIEDWEA